MGGQSLDGREVKPRKHRGGGRKAGGMGCRKHWWPRMVLCEQLGGFFKSFTLIKVG